ncbi:3-hydroxyisobutyrate dehydrogenase [Mucilaginibacter gossypiicola]|uniref:3-hydroxyisobutyrate dehydrogenase n=1 Tax=Mucilaginibacter gossypiicola TaxID=551995 RepID=A0A1H8TBC6_9SPHI|nr:NAD(P)-dependent oxidoreductase [Mucilaginibacter gossypiicola]SEO88400.1 3-hydroxyisobutyrate dehydrogenase [Mucilaginibacter gossypiicola]
MNTVKIGWIGLGKMGVPMSQQLIKAGYPLNVYNRSKDKEEGFKSQGIGTAASPALLLNNADVVFVMVSDDKAINDIFNGDEGLLTAKASGKIIINMSTVSPSISKEMAAACKAQGNYYLDAPVSGSVKQAEDAMLVIMVGGEAGAFEQAKPILEKMGKLVMLVGNTGSGNVAKLAINTLLGIVAQGFAETVTLAQQNGINAEALTTLISNSALGSPFIKIKGDAIVNNNYNAAFALKHIAKDLRLAKDLGLATPLGETAYQTYQDAEAAFGEEDIIAVIKQVGKV